MLFYWGIVDSYCTLKCLELWEWNSGVSWCFMWVEMFGEGRKKKGDGKESFSFPSPVP